MIRASTVSDRHGSSDSQLQVTREKKAPGSDDPGAVMVEVARIELASEELQRNDSTCVADRFSFATPHAHRQA